MLPVGIGYRGDAAAQEGVPRGAQRRISTGDGYRHRRRGQRSQDDGVETVVRQGTVGAEIIDEAGHERVAGTDRVRDVHVECRHDDIPLRRPNPNTAITSGQEHRGHPQVADATHDVTFVHPGIEPRGILVAQLHQMCAACGSFEPADDLISIGSESGADVRIHGDQRTSPGRLLEEGEHRIAARVEEQRDRAGVHDAADAEGPEGRRPSDVEAVPRAASVVDESDGGRRRGRSERMRAQEGTRCQDMLGDSVAARICAERGPQLHVRAEPRRTDRDVGGASSDVFGAHPVALDDIDDRLADDQDGCLVAHPSASIVSCVSGCSMSGAMRSLNAAVQGDARCASNAAWSR